MNPDLRNRLIGAAGAGAIAIAGVLGHWYEGDGPTVKVDGQLMHKPYRDPVGIWTVCRGVTGPEVIPAKLYSQAECRALETKHLRIAENGVKTLVQPYAELNEYQQAALIDFSYNLGLVALEGSTMRRLFNTGDIEGGCRELARWVKGRVKGELITLRGLVDRRGAELELCLEWGAS